MVYENGKEAQKRSGAGNEQAPHRLYRSSGIKTDLQRKADESPRAWNARELQRRADESPRAWNARELQRRADESPRARNARELQRRADESPRARNARELQRRADESSRTPDRKSGGNILRGYKISHPGDPSEKEADKIADQITGAAPPAKIVNKTEVSRKETTCGPVSGQIDSAVSSGGTSLPAGLKEEMEGKIGRDFSSVKVHNDTAAHESAAAINARAYTMGSDIVFAGGEYSPGSASGRRLIAHELVHVAQQGAGIHRQTPVDTFSLGNYWPSFLKRYDYPRGYDSMIITYLDMIQDKKKEILDAWVEDEKIEHERPGMTVLKIALSIVSAGLGGVMSGIIKTVGKEILGKLTVEFAAAAAKKATEMLSNRLGQIAVVNPLSSAQLEACAQKAVADNRAGNLIDYYKLAMYDAFDMDRIEEESKIASLTDPGELELAFACDIYKDTFDSLRQNNGPFLTELSKGYMKLLDELYLSTEAENYEGATDQEKLADMYARSGTIDQTAERPGKLLLVGPIYSIGSYHSPDIRLSHAIVKGINEETAEHLEGAAVGGLPFTLAFRFWGSLGHGLFDEPAKVWFVRRPDGTIVVDLDESWEIDSHGWDEGREWLARYYLQTDERLTREQINDNTAKGALKVYNVIKTMPVPRTMNLSIFQSK